MVDEDDGVRPPVSEVVLSFAFDKPDQNLLGPRLHELLGDSYPDDAVIEAVGPYVLLPETFPARPGVLPDMLFGLQQFSEPRYWVSSVTRPEIVVQVQGGYLALNWRERDQGLPYLRYPGMQAEFKERIGGVYARLGRPPITCAEMTYINVVDRPDDGADIVPRAIFPMFGPEGDAIDSFVWSYSREFGERATRTHGRIRANMTTGWQSKDLREVYTLNLSSRSGELGGSSFDQLVSFFDAAHNALNEEFRSLVSPNALKTWGLL